MFEMFLEMLKACGNDVSMHRDSRGCYCVEFDDFEGFDDDWDEVMREYDNPIEVEALENWLEEQCESQEGSLYVMYHFEGFDVEVGYSSFDI